MYLNSRLDDDDEDDDEDDDDDDDDDDDVVPRGPAADTDISVHFLPSPVNHDVCSF